MKTSNSIRTISMIAMVVILTNPTYAVDKYKSPQFQLKQFNSAQIKRKVSPSTISTVSKFNLRERKKFFNRLPLDPDIKTKLSRDRDGRYLVVTNALSGRSHKIERRTWTGKILLPDLRKRGKAKSIRYISKPQNAYKSRQNVAWFIENPDGSLSKQILNSRGKLSGNITFTQDDTVRIGLDLTGNQEADLYEIVMSNGEFSLMASSAGQAAIEHFRNSGKNPLCNMGAPGASSAGNSFAMGMISGSDKTAMQVVCGRKNQPGNAGFAAGGGGGISGDPGGRAADAMCKKVLKRHRGRPGNPGMVMGDSLTESMGDSIVNFIENGVDGKKDSFGMRFTRLVLSPLYVPTLILGADAYDEIIVGTMHGSPGLLNLVREHAEERERIPHTRTRGLPAPPHTSDTRPTRPSPHSPPGDTHISNRNSSQPGLCDSATQCCPDVNAPNWVETNPASGRPTGGNNSTDPGPDQQNDPDAAILSWCQARAKNKSWWASIEKDTRYVKQLCENPASQPNPAGMAGSTIRASSTTLGGSYDSSITLTTYCGQYGGNRGVPSPSDRLSGQTGDGSNCGRTESPGADGKCHGVGTQFNGGSAGKVNISYGAVIGIPLFDPRVTNPDLSH